jgi:hypothetical protein
MESKELLDVARRLATDRDAREQLARTPAVYLGRFGIAPETARALAPVLTAALTTGIVFGSGAQIEWAPQWPAQV